METTKKMLDQLWRKLVPLRNMDPHNYRAFTGFDGFIDNIQKAVWKKGTNTTRYFKTVAHFTEHLQTMHEAGGNIETVTTKQKVGGNAPNLSNTLGNLGIQTYCLGAMGYPDIHPVFFKMHKLCEIISVIDPAENRVLEFDDAKIVFSEVGVFDHYNWEYIKTHTTIFNQLKDIVSTIQLFALVDWVNLPYASSIWRGFLDDLVKNAGKKDALFFFHLGDPYKMGRKTIGETIELINDFAHYGEVTLSLNENEATKLWLVLNGYDSAQNPSELNLPALSEVSRFVFRVFDIHTVIVRTPEKTYVATEEKVREIVGRKVDNPRILMGSGDNFDAGYCLGMLQGLDGRQCALLGIAASGAYIQNGYSPCVEDLIEYLKSWADEKETSNQLSKPLKK